MAQIVHEHSGVDWSGTFGYNILLPGPVIGVAPRLGRAPSQHRWPASLALARPLTPAARGDPVQPGPTGGARDLLGRPRRRSNRRTALRHGRRVRDLRARTPLDRLACGALALTAIPIWPLTVEFFAGADLAVTTPRGLWVAI